MPAGVQGESVARNYAEALLTLPGVRRWGSRDARSQIECQAQGQIQRGRVRCQPGACLFLTLDVQRRGDIAPLEDLARRIAQGRFQRVKAIGQAQAQIEPPPIDAAHFPKEGSTIGQGAIGTGETGHGSKLGHASFLPQEE